MNAASLYAAGRSAGPGPLPRDLEGACRALEKEFANLLFQKMRQAMVPRATAGSGGFARETAEALLDSQWADLASQGEGLGLWRALVRELGPETVKSPRPAADQGIRTGGSRMEAGRDLEADSSAPGAGARVGGLRRERDPSVLPGTAAVPGARPRVGGGEGT